MTNLDEQNVIKDYKSGMTRRQIAEKYHVATATIASIVKGLPSQK